MTFSQLIDLYLATHSISDKHSYSILAMARRFLSANGDIEVVNIAEEHVGRFFAAVRRFSGSAWTQKNNLSQLAAVLRYATAIGQMPKVPIMPRVRPPKSVPTAWNEDSFRRIYAACCAAPGRVGVIPADLWWSSLVAAAYHTGSRVGALLAVRWSDLSIDAGVIVLRSTKSRVEEIHRLPDYLLQKLHALRWPPREIIWEHPYHREWLLRAFRRILRRAEMEPERNRKFALFHQVRRTAASIAAKDGGVAAAQRLLGHANPRITIEHYIDPRVVGPVIVPLPPLESGPESG